jgi:hypothetical protein
LLCLVDTKAVKRESSHLLAKTLTQVQGIFFYHGEAILARQCAVHAEGNCYQSGVSRSRNYGGSEEYRNPRYCHVVSESSQHRGMAWGSAQGLGSFTTRPLPPPSYIAVRLLNLAIAKLGQIVKISPFSIPLPRAPSPKKEATQRGYIHSQKAPVMGYRDPVRGGYVLGCAMQHWFVNLMR